ncbi:hypothetical protein [Hymenobacter wooponensis]|uniref:Uncharacterized protein n=1 Tax=Hymenobacter wooponensis TaxID=1525360 RepID=A0A4Z0ME88_9BACT|nr:hypothetical protein [Hymenobacter wooponensis]TGD77680.1 hypothetical protein EU557_23195 [Hymenobacter wooponensis]
MKISAIAHFNNEQIPCFGKITIASIKYPQARVIWALNSAEGIVAGKAANLYFPYGEEETYRLFETVLAYIKTYRVGRRRIFTDVTIVA